MKNTARTYPSTHRSHTDGPCILCHHSCECCFTLVKASFTSASATAYFQYVTEATLLPSCSSAVLPCSLLVSAASESPTTPPAAFWPSSGLCCCVLTSVYRFPPPLLVCASDGVNNRLHTPLNPRTVIPSDFERSWCTAIRVKRQNLRGPLGSLNGVTTSSRQFTLTCTVCLQSTDELSQTPFSSSSLLLLTPSKYSFCKLELDLARCCMVDFVGIRPVPPKLSHMCSRVGRRVPSVCVSQHSNRTLSDNLSKFQGRALGCESYILCIICWPIVCSIWLFSSKEASD